MKISILMVFVLSLIISSETYGQKTNYFKARTIYDIGEVIQTASPSKDNNQPMRQSYFANYDESKNESIVSSAPEPISVEADSNFRGNPTFSVLFIFKGELLRQPPRGYIIRISSKSEKRLFLKNNDLYFVADGRQIRLGRAFHDGEITKGGITENLLYAINARDFETLAKSKAVQIKIGSYKGSLLENNLAAIQTIYKLSR